MAKATNESKLSRRAVIGGIAATPILAAPVIAAAEADPSFAVIEAHATASERLGELFAAQKPLREKLKDLGFDRLPRVEYGKSSIGCAPGEFQPVYFYAVGCIESHIEGFRSTGLYDTPKARANLEKRREMLLSGLQEDAEAIAHAEHETGYSAVRADYLAAAAAEEAAMESVIRTKPTTFAGLDALTAFVSEQYCELIDRGVGEGEEDYEDALQVALATIAEATRRLATA